MKSFLLILLFQLVILFAYGQPVQKLDDDNVANISNNEVQHRYPRALKQKPLQCSLNQYYDEEEGRCLGVVGGGRVLYINNTKSCGKNILKPHCSNPRYYYICKQNRTILAQCGHSRHFDNRLQKCVPVSKEEYVSATISPNADVFEPMEIPDCQTTGSFPVPDECALFYTCESNGHRLHQSFYRCPKDMAYDPTTNMCALSSTCNDLSPWWCASNVKKENFTLEEAEKPTRVSKLFTLDDENNSSLCETAFATDEQITTISTDEFTESTSSYQSTTISSNINSDMTSVGTDDSFASTTVSNSGQTIPELAEFDDKSDITRTTERDSETSRTTNIVDNTTTTYSDTEETTFTKAINLESNTEIGTNETPIKEFATTVDSVTTEKHAITEAEKIVQSSSTEDEGIVRKATIEIGITNTPIFLTDPPTFRSRETDTVTETSTSISTERTAEADGETDQKSSTGIETTVSTVATSTGLLVHDTTKTKIDSSTQSSTTVQMLEVTTGKSINVTRPEAIVQDPDKEIRPIIAGSTIRSETPNLILATSTTPFIHDTTKTKIDSFTQSSTTVQMLEVTTGKSINVTRPEAIVEDPDKAIQTTLGGSTSRIETTSSIPVTSTTPLVPDTTEIKVGTSTESSTTDQSLEITTAGSINVTKPEAIVEDPDKKFETVLAESATRTETPRSIQVTPTTPFVNDITKPKIDSSTESSTTEQLLEITTAGSISVTEAEPIIGNPDKEIQTTAEGSTTRMETTGSTPITSTEPLVHDTIKTKMATSTESSTTEQLLEVTTVGSINVTKPETIVEDPDKKFQTVLAESATRTETVRSIPVTPTTPFVNDITKTKIDSSTESSTTEQLLEITTAGSISVTEAEPIIGNPDKEIQTTAEGSTTRMETTGSTPITSTEPLVHDTSKTKMITSTESSTTEQSLEVTTGQIISVTKPEAIVEDPDKKIQTIVAESTARTETTSSILVTLSTPFVHNTTKTKIDSSTESSTAEQLLEVTTAGSINVTKPEAIVEDPDKKFETVLAESATRTETPRSIPVTPTTPFVNDTTKTKIDSSTESSTTEQLLEVTTGQSINVTKPEAIVEDPDKKFQTVLAESATRTETPRSIPVTPTTPFVNDITKPKIDSSTESSTPEQLLEITTAGSISVTEAEAIVEDPDQKFETVLAESATRTETPRSIPVTPTTPFVNDTTKTKIDSSTESSTTEQLLEVTTGQSINVTKPEAIVEDPDQKFETVLAESATRTETPKSIPVTPTTPFLNDITKPKIDSPTESSTTEQLLEVTTVGSISVPKAEPIIGNPDKEIETTAEGSTTRMETTSSTPITSTEPLVHDTSKTKMITSMESSTTEQSLEVTTGQIISVTRPEAIVEDPDKKFETVLAESATRTETPRSIPATSTTPFIHDTTKTKTDTSAESSATEQLLEVTTGQSINVTKPEAIVENPDKEIQTTIKESAIRIETTGSIALTSTTPFVHDTTKTKIDTSTESSTTEQLLKLTTVGNISVTKAEPIVGASNKQIQTTVEGSTTRIDPETSATVSVNDKKSNVTKESSTPTTIIDESSTAVNANDTKSNTTEKSAASCLDNKSTVLSPSIQALLAHCRAYVLAEAAKNGVATPVLSDASSTQKYNWIADENRTSEVNEKFAEDSDRTISKHIAFPLASAVLNITDRFERHLRELLKGMVR